MSTNNKPGEDISSISEMPGLKNRVLRMVPLTVLLFLSVAGFCQSNQAITNKVDSIIERPGFISDIPPDIRRSYWYKSLMEEVAALKLNSIEKGYPGLQIRIWVGHGYGDMPKNSTQLLIFDRSVWGDQGRILTYQAKYNSTRDSISSVKRKADSLNPKSGWISFWRKLEKLRIYYLPNYSTLFDYEMASDSDGVIVEVADGTKYRIYYYPDYVDNKDRIKEAGEFYAIMKMMENEFRIKLIY